MQTGMGWPGFGSGFLKKAALYRPPEGGTNDGADAQDPSRPSGFPGPPEGGTPNERRADSERAGYGFKWRLKIF